MTNTRCCTTSVFDPKTIRFTVSKLSALPTWAQVAGWRCTVREAALATHELRLLHTGGEVRVELALVHRVGQVLDHDLGNGFCKNDVTRKL